MNTIEESESKTGLEFALPSRRLHASSALDMVQRAEARGWGGVWASEVLGLDGLILVGAAARETQRLRLGTAVVPISTRSAALLAMAASTVSQLAPHRFKLGLGLSTPAIVEARHDRAVRRPLAEAQGTIQVVRAALRGEKVTHPEFPAVSDLAIEAPPVAPPILLAALGPRMTEIAYDHADGLVLNLVPFDEAASRARDGRHRRGTSFETAMSIRVCVEPNRDDLAAIRRELASYCRVDAYGRSLERLGWDLQSVRAAPDLDVAARRLPTELVDELVVVGSPRDCSTRLAALVEAGVTAIVVGAGVYNASDRVLDLLDPVV